MKTYFAFIFGAALLLLALTHVLLRKIRAESPELFINLGKPDLFGSNDMASVYRFWRWLYGDVLNNTLSIATRRIALVLRTGSVLYIICVAAGIISTIISGS